MRRAYLGAIGGVVVLAAALALVGTPAAHGAQTLCDWVQGYTNGADGSSANFIHTWTHRSTWRTWSNPNSWGGRRWSGSTITYETSSLYGGYDEFVNASNNWRWTDMNYLGQGPYNPGTNWRWEQWSTIGC